MLTSIPRSRDPHSLLARCSRHSLMLLAKRHGTRGSAVLLADPWSSLSSFRVLLLALAARSNTMPSYWAILLLLVSAVPQSTLVYGLPADTQHEFEGVASQDATEPRIQKRQASTVLTPRPAPGIDTSHHGHLVPNPGVRLFYSQEAGNHNANNNQISSAAVVSVPEMQNHVVNMLHSSSISSIQCTDNTATINFNNKAAFDVAVRNWTPAVPFIMITYHDGCGDAQTSGQHGYMIVDSVDRSSPGALTVTLDVAHVEFAQAVSPDVNITVSIGSYSPSGNTGFNTTVPAGGSTATHDTTGDYCGSFDECLDASLGPVISLGNKMDWEQVLPGMPIDSVRSSKLQERRWNPFKAAEGAIEHAGD